MDRSGWRMFLLRVCLIVGLAAGWHAVTEAQAQVARAAEVAEPRSLTERVFLPPDRKMVRMLDTVEKLLDQSRFSEAVRALARIVNADEDYFFRSKKGQHLSEGRNYYSLKTEARRLIGRLPKPARASYELQFGPTARRRLRRAMEAFDIGAVAEVQRRYAYTEAGLEAAVILGRYYMDQGQPLAAALCFRDVYRSQAASRYEPALSVMLAACWQRAGMSPTAATVLIALKRKYPRSTFEIGGREIDLFETDDEAMAWLADAVGQQRDLGSLRSTEWVMFRGNASRTGSQDGGAPLLLRPRWRQPVLSNVGSEKRIAKQWAEYGSKSIAAIPALQPLALHGVVLMRTPNRVVAIDFKTGKRIWQARSESGMPSHVAEGEAKPGVAMPTAKVVERVWIDKTYGSMSSDNERVFVLEGFGLKLDGMPRDVIDQNGRRRIYSGTPYNRLTAYQVRQSQGKRVWSVGGPAGEDPELAQAFFLGPPLPMQGRLFCIVEMNGEVRLVVLDGSTGKAAWSQQLAVIGTSRQFETYRRTGGLSPSFSDGVLVCPTGVGAIVAIDLTTRDLMWGYQYPAPTDNLARHRRMALRRVPSLVKVGDHWVDSCAVIAGGQLIVTPAESGQIHCLKLSDGSVQWRVERKEGLYLACVHDGVAVIVGREQLTAIDTATGKVAKGWPLKLPDGAKPSGRGYQADGHYYLPMDVLGEGEVAVIRLDAPKIVRRAESRNKTIPGNLIAYRDQIISQGVDWLQSYHQLEPLQKEVNAALAKNAEDPWALFHQGELLEDRSSSADTVDLFRRSRDSYAALLSDPAGEKKLRRGDNAAAGKLMAGRYLFEELLDSLRVDYASHRGSVDEVRQLIESSDDRLDFLRVLATSQHAAGELEDAINSYVELLDVAQRNNPLMRMDRVQSVRLQHWLRFKVHEIQPDLQDAGRKRWSAGVAERQRVVLRDGSLASLRRFETIFGDDPMAWDVRQRLAEQLGKSGRTVEQCMQLRALLDSPSGEQQRAATAHLALLFEKAQRYRESAYYYRILQTEFSDQVCYDGRTGKELLAALSEKSPVRKVVQRVEWPLGKVKVVRGKSNFARPQVRHQPPMRLSVLSRRNPLFDRMSIYLDQQFRQALIAKDDEGNQRWATSLMRPDGMRSRAFGTGVVCGRIDGPLLIVSTGIEVMAIDMMGSMDGKVGNAPILWRKDAGVSVNVASAYVPVSATDPVPWGDSSQRHFRKPKVSSRLGPITPGGVTFVDHFDLVSVDPVSGEILWRRNGVPRNAELFGDDEYVLMVSAGRSDATVISAIDGALLGKRQLPTVATRWAFVDRNVLVWRTKAKGSATRQLALFDPWMQKDVWVREIQKGTKGTRVGEDALALLEPDGHFVVLDLKTGDSLLDQSIEPEPDLKGVYVIRSRADYVLVTNQGATLSDKTKSYQPMPSAHGSALVTGRIYVFDRASGEPRWQIPATVKQQGFVLQQPGELPVVVFCRRLYDRKKRKNTLALLVIDKRTGQLALPLEERLANTSNFVVVGDARKKKVAIQFQNQAADVTLEFTDKAVAPGPPFQVASKPNLKKGPLSATIGGLLRAIGQAAQDVQGLTTDNDDHLFEPAAGKKASPQKVQGKPEGMK